MKHGYRALLTLILAALVMSAGAARAEKRATGDWYGTPVFYVSYDEREFILDTDEYTEENTETHRWQFVLYARDMMVDCAIEYFESLKNTNFFDMDDEKIMQYVRRLVASDWVYKSEYVETRRIPLSRGNETAEIPFIIMKLTYEDGGQTYYAETLTNGYTIYFEVYGAGNTIGAAELDCLRRVVDTFRPIV